MVDEDGKQWLGAMTALVAARGEPFLTFMQPAALAAQVRELGFENVWDVRAEEVNSRYCATRTDGLCFPRAGRIMRAQVGRPPT
jgi:hypothetical protein